MAAVALTYIIPPATPLAVIDFDMLPEDDESEEVGFEYEDLLDWQLKEAVDRRDLESFTILIEENWCHDLTLENGDNLLGYMIKQGHALTEEWYDLIGVTTTCHANPEGGLPIDLLRKHMGSCRCNLESMNCDLVEYIIRTCYAHPINRDYVYHRMDTSRYTHKRLNRNHNLTLSIEKKPIIVEAPPMEEEEISEVEDALNVLQRLCAQEEGDNKEAETNNNNYVFPWMTPAYELPEQLTFYDMPMTPFNCNNVMYC